MIIIIPFLILALVFYIFLNYTNKFTYIISSYFISITGMLFTAIAYITRISQYRYPDFWDYQLYLWIYNFNFSVQDISRLYNFCFALFMITSFALISFLTQRTPRQTRTKKYVHSILYCLCGIVPIVFYVIWTDHTTTLSLYLLEKGNNPVLWKSISQIGNTLCNLIFITYLLLPPVFIGIKYFKSQIFIKKRQMAIMEIYMLLINGFTFFVFMSGTFNCIYFTNVNFTKLPTETPLKNSHITLSLIIWVVIVVLLYSALYFKPFGAIRFFARNNMKRIQKMFNKNLSMVFHVYKNALLSVGHQLKMIKIYSDKNDHSEIELHTENGITIIDEYMKITARMLYLLRNIRAKMSEINLATCIDKAIVNFSAVENVTFKKNFGDIYILGDENYITEVFVNLFQNAIEATRRACKDPVISISSTCEDDYCLIEIQDNGPGIEKKLLKDVFELFFSTKNVSTVGGMGLNYVKNIIQCHSGEIRAISELGKYTTFQIALPIIRKKEYSYND